MDLWVDRMFAAFIGIAVIVAIGVFATIDPPPMPPDAEPTQYENAGPHERVRVVCMDGVSYYYQSHRFLTVKWGPDSKVVPCENGDTE